MRGQIWLNKFHGWCSRLYEKRGGGGACEIFIVQDQVASLPYHYIYENLYLQ